MGQYREWLFYREIDQQLTAQIQASEQELAHVQMEIEHLERDTRYADNIIIQALIGLQQAQQIHSQGAAAEAAAVGQRASSPALFAWNQLPQLDNRDAQPVDDNVTLPRPLPAPTGSDSSLTPTSSSGFMDANSLTDPQLKVPWWLRNAHAHKEIPTGAPGTSPVDQQSTRTNQLVERWFERWGERTRDSAPKQEGQGE
ncbi:hypothetical protein KDH_62190 [Dictyobacter sp. S3.2.2.5]|uniref:Uncharacterized protein n=1 Tax=Dictyobacter halimunensis TaxID=3026934 RepID=A0ABQ6G0F6_9CHLR|nr:hypothetical protein KDH_62190 [Dictyobacter sp. S3.2.2.5]